LSAGVSKIFKVDLSANQYFEIELLGNVKDMFWRDPGANDLDMFYAGSASTLTDGIQT
jgi:hypothetical protein